jgi:hypothetical protein
MEGACDSVLPNEYQLGMKVSIWWLCSSNASDFRWIQGVHQSVNIGHLRIGCYRSSTRYGVAINSMIQTELQHTGASKICPFDYKQ